MNTDLIPALQQTFETNLPDNISYEELKEKLSVYINQLIQHDFPKLLNILYRVDISESKLKQVLKEKTEEDTGKIIAEMIIERQLEKIQSRTQHSTSDKNISGEEMW